MEGTFRKCSYAVKVDDRTSALVAGIGDSKRPQASYETLLAAASAEMAISKERASPSLT
jgi:hypothetical protein